MRLIRIAASLLLWLTACAPDSPRGDGNPPAVDAGTPVDASGSDEEDSGPRRCPDGQHVCGTGCVADQQNTPERGCTYGCGEACPAPRGGFAECTGAGTCGFDCMPPSRRAGDACVCSPRTCESMGYMCGAPDDGCGSLLHCGACPSGLSCNEGVCACARDGGEPSDDSRATTTQLDSFDDAQNPRTVEVRMHNLDSADDIDWFRFRIVDGTDGTNPILNVKLDMIPAGTTYSLAAFFVCGEGTDASSCNTGENDRTIGRGCAATAGPMGTAEVEVNTECEHLSTSEDGTMYVRVQATTWAASCQDYRLRVNVR